MWNNPYPILEHEGMLYNKVLFFNLGITAFDGSKTIITE